MSIRSFYAKLLHYQIQDQAKELRMNIKAFRDKTGEVCVLIVKNTLTGNR
jgi:hypothetical protein